MLSINRLPLLALLAAFCLVLSACPDDEPAQNNSQKNSSSNNTSNNSTSNATTNNATTTQDMGSQDMAPSDMGQDQGQMDMGAMDQGQDQGTPDQGDPDQGQDMASQDMGSQDMASGCQAEVEALTKELYAKPQGCSVVVELDYQTLGIDGFQVFCGAYKKLTEAEARKQADNDTGYGLMDRMLNPADPADTWVFHKPAGDFGGASAVAAHTGLTVFGGSIVWSGRGDTTYPKMWRDPVALGQNCASTARIPAENHYSLEAPITDAERAKVLDVIRSTAILDAFWAGGYVFHATVLGYARSVGVFAPSEASYIAIIHGGWLE